MEYGLFKFAIIIPFLLNISNKYSLRCNTIVRRNCTVRPMSSFLFRRRAGVNAASPHSHVRVKWSISSQKFGMVRIIRIFSLLLYRTVKLARSCGLVSIRFCENGPRAWRLSKAFASTRCKHPMHQYHSLSFVRIVKMV
jgi:hypothetical protein